MEGALALLIPIVFLVAAAAITITAMSQHHLRRIEEIRARAQAQKVDSSGVREELAELKDRMNVLIMAMEGRRPASAEAERALLAGRLASSPPPIPSEALENQQAGRTGL